MTNRRRVRSLKYGIMAIALVVALLVPFLFNSSLVLDVARGWATALAIVGLVLLTGFTKQVSIGQNFFYAIGGYISARALVGIETTSARTVLILLVAAAVSALVAYGMGMVILRIRGIYLALITLGLGLATPALVLRFHVHRRRHGHRRPAPVPARVAGPAVRPVDLPGRAILLVGGMAWAVRIERGPFGFGDEGRRGQRASRGQERAVSRSVGSSRSLSPSPLPTRPWPAWCSAPSRGSSPRARSRPMSRSRWWRALLSLATDPSCSHLLGGLFVIFAPIRLEQINEFMSGVLFGLAIVLLMVFLPGGLASIIARRTQRAGA